MISYMIITAVILMLLGLAVLLRARSTAVTGYEDEFGFHEGIDPQRRLVQASVGPVSAIAQAAKAGDGRAKAKRPSKRPSRDLVGQGSTAPF
jgi:hypothetical protein